MQGDEIKPDNAITGNSKGLTVTGSIANVNEVLAAHERFKERSIVESKQFRKELDDILQRLKAASGHVETLEELRGSGSGHCSRHRSLAITHLEYAIMRLGMDLKVIGTPNPYPNSYNPENTIVDKTADGLKL